MTKRRFAIISTSVCLLIITALTAAASESSASSFVGTWKLDVAKSSYGNMPTPKFEQLVFTSDSAASLKWSLKGVGLDGKSYISSFEGPIDGKQHRIISSEGSNTASYTRTGSSLNWIVKDKDGTVFETGSGQLSPDGKTMTVHATVQGSKSKSEFVSVFNRAQ